MKTYSLLIVAVTLIGVAVIYAPSIKQALFDTFKIGYVNGLPDNLLTKDAEPSMAEIKKAIDDLGKAHDAFKSANDDRLGEIEKKGAADVVLEEKVNKINAAVGELDKLKAGIDALETKINMAQLGGGGAQTAPDKVEHAKAFDVYFRKGRDEGLGELEKKAMATDSDPDGGFVVPSETEVGIDRVLSEVSPMRGLARVQTISSPAYKKLINEGGTTSGWVGERETRSETGTPKLVELVFNAMELYAEPHATQSLLDDAAVNIEAWLSDEVTIEFAEQEGAAFITGDGIKRPRGFLDYTTVANGSYTHDKIGYIASGAAGAFATSDPSDALIDLIHALKQGYRQGARFMMNDLTLAVIRKFKDANGDYIWTPGLQAGLASLLLGYGVSEAGDMPDVAANSLSIAFGDFKRGYLIVDRIGIRVLRDPFTTKPYIKFYTTKRVGGGVQKFEAIKVMKMAAS